MNDELNKAAKPDEPPAQAMPDPAGPPQPVAKDDDVLRGLSVVGVVLVAGGGLLFPMIASTSSTQGAMRSTKIQWEQRQVEIRRAMAENQGPPPSQEKSGGSPQGAGDRGGK